MLGPIIPPSVMFVVYSVLAQVAVGDMLMAGILPGILLTVLFFIVIACMGLVYNYPRSEKKTLRERARTIALASPTLLIPSSSSAPSSRASPTRPNRPPWAPWSRRWWAGS
jgi:TRAP-type C4-dicarboxylate transport system permease large subunit